MESVIDEIFLYSKVESDPQVAFTVVPGFRIGKTVLQCQVYISQHQTKVKKNQFNKAKVVVASTYWPHNLGDWTGRQFIILLVKKKFLEGNEGPCGGDWTLPRLTH